MKTVVLIADDNAVMRRMLHATLADRFDVVEVESGEAALALLDGCDPQRVPDLVLLDIEMHQLDGYETCKRLRAAGHRMPVLFVSAHNALDERLQAYDAGADDFISKPFDSNEVLRKIGVAVDRHLRTKGIEALAQQARRDIGEKGILLDFLREAIRVTDHVKLMQCLLRSAGDIGVRCHVQVRCDDGTFTLTPTGEATPLELSIMEHAVSLGQRFRFGRRMIINYHLVSVLILDLPDDEERVLRIAGCMETLVESTEAVVEVIAMRRESAARAETLMVASAKSYFTIQELREAQLQQQRDTRQLLQQLIDEVERSYVSLWLTEKQEIEISTLIRTGADKILQLFNRWAEIDEKFQAVLTSLKSRGDNDSDIWL